MPKFSLNRLLNIQGIKTMTKDIYREWTLSKLEENPKLFGGDRGNPAIMKEYLTQMHKGTKVEDLTIEAFSQIVSISRMKNKLLEVYPEFDYRVLYKRYNAQCIDERTPTLFDDDVA